MRAKEANGYISDKYPVIVSDIAECLPQCT